MVMYSKKERNACFTYFRLLGSMVTLTSNGLTKWGGGE